MPRRVLKQPNGKLAIFSTVVDCAVWYNCTPEECVDIFYDEEHMHPEDAQKKVRRGIDDLVPYTNQLGDGRQRWDDDMFMMLIIHGTEDQDKLDMLAECGMKPAEIAHWVSLANRARCELDETGGTDIHARWVNNQHS
jgi:hypothetical protein